MHLFQGGDVDFDEFSRARLDRGERVEARRQRLGVGFDRFGQVKVAAEVEQGGLANASAFAAGD